MALKTPDQRVLPQPNPQLSRGAAWAVVVENDGWVKTVVHRFVTRIMGGSPSYFGYSAAAMFDELLSTAYESALVAAETFDPAKGFTFTTYSHKVIWRDLTDELVRWRSNTSATEYEMRFEAEMDQQRGGDPERSGDFLHEDVNAALMVDPFDDIDGQLDAERDAAKVRAALNEREFLTLALTAEGYTPKEIGQKLGITGGNARVILHRARDKARATLEGAAA